jgi:hypothetical protein
MLDETIKNVGEQASSIVAATKEECFSLQRLLTQEREKTRILQTHIGHLENQLNSLLDRL